MIVKNWMSKNPETISSDLSAKQAMQKFEEVRVPFLSVVDEGRFRGFLARRDLRDVAAWAVSSQDVNEIQYFNNALKVKDIMVRKPVTVSANDTVEKALKKGRSFGRVFLPVMEDEKLVGSLSNRDLSKALEQLLTAEEGVHSASISINGDAQMTIQKILNDIFDMGLKIKGLFTLQNPDSEGKRLIIRFEAKCLKKIVSLIKEKGYDLIEVVDQEK